MKFVIVGGGGYIGFHIGKELSCQGHEVLLFDLQTPDKDWKHDTAQLKFIEGSVLDKDALRLAFESSDCIIHCASFGMSGKEQMPVAWDKTECVNVRGTYNVIEAAASSGATALVYTSTFNVTFGGQEIQLGNENLPYFPLHRHVDHYSRTKSIAEQLVLISDGKFQLRTCALRLAGVVGYLEKRHLPRIVANFPLVKFKYGYGESLVQFCTLRNVVQAHVKAAMALLKKPNVVGGQAYFISDGVPINNLEFFRPLMESLGYTFPSVTVPMWLIWTIAYASQILHSTLAYLSAGRINFVPILCPAEVYKTAVSHYFSNDKAKEHFEYEPQSPNDISDAIQYFQRQFQSASTSKNPINFRFCSVIFLFSVIILLFYSILPF